MYLVDSFRDYPIFFIDEEMDPTKPWIQPGWYVGDNTPLEHGPFPDKLTAKGYASKLADVEIVREINPDYLLPPYPTEWR